MTEAQTLLPLPTVVEAVDAMPPESVAVVLEAILDRLAKLDWDGMEPFLRGVRNAHEDAAHAILNASGQ